MLARNTAALFAVFLVPPSVHGQPPGNTRTDAIGDPLPNGVIARLGSTRFTHFGARFQCGIFAPDGKTFGFVGGSTNVNIWDVTSGKLFDLASDGGKAFQSISPVFSRDGKTLVVAQDNAIVVWSLAEKKRLQRLTATPEFFPRAIALTDNDKTVIGVSHDGALRWGTLPRAWKIAFGGRSNQNQNSPNMMTCLRKLSVMR